MCVWLDVLKLSIVLNVPVLLLPSLHDDILMLSCEGLGVQLDFYLVLAPKHLFFSLFWLQRLLRGAARQQLLPLVSRTDSSVKMMLS